MNTAHILPRANGEADFDFYPYNPNKSAGWAFTVLFAVGGVIHLGYIIPYRSWFFIPFILGCAAEVGGYYGRAWAHDNIRLGKPYLLQLFLIIGATPLLSATIYMTLSRVVKALDASRQSLVRITWVSKIYILIDIACLVLQVMGTVTQAYGGADQQDTAIRLVAGGLVFQLVAFLVFMLLAAIVHKRLVKDPTEISSRSDVRWKRYFWALYAGSLLILIRNLVRIVEYVQGADGAVASSEAYLYVFDALPMLAVVVLFTVLHPGRLIKRTKQALKPAGDELNMPLVYERV